MFIWYWSELSVWQHYVLETVCCCWLLSRFSHVRLCATPETAAHQAPPSLGFSRQEHWSGLPFPSSMHESEKWKWSCLVVSNSSQPHGLQPTGLLCPWDFPGKSTGVGCHCLLHRNSIHTLKNFIIKHYHSSGCSLSAGWLSCLSVDGLASIWSGRLVAEGWSGCGSS